MFNNNKPVLYVIPQNNTNTSKMNSSYNTPESVGTRNSNKRLHSFSSSDNLGKRRRVSPLSINTVKNNYPVYIQQPVIVTNYYKPQMNTHNKVADCKPHPQQKQSSKQPTIDISNQFKVTQVSEVFQGCSELSLPKLVIYLIYKIWCSCNLSQYQPIDTPIPSNNVYASPRSNNTSQQNVNYTPYYSTPVTYARIPSPVTPSSSESSFDCPYDKVNILYKNICQSKIFQEPIKKSSNECVITINSDDEESSRKQVEVDPKDLETQILKACSRSCRGELKNNYSKLIDYVDHLLKITQISFSSVILALEYIYRLKEASQTPEGKFLNQWSYEEIIPVAFMMANKFVSDDRYSNTVWANVTNISLNHLNDLEMKGLVAISFRLYVSQSNYNNWIQLIKNVSRDLTLKYKQFKEPQNHPPKTEIPIVSYKLTPKSCTTDKVSSPSSSTSTAMYSPITPSKIQQIQKNTASNVYVSKNSVPPSKYHVINIMPPQSQPASSNSQPQLIPNIPVPRSFKPQSTIIAIPTSQPVSVPPFQSSTVIPKVQQVPSNQPIVFFPKLNNTQSKQQFQPTVVRQNVSIYPVEKNTIYPSPPLSRTTSPNPESFEKYLIHNNKNSMNTIQPQFIKTGSYKSTSIINPFIKRY